MTDSKKTIDIYRQKVLSRGPIPRHIAIIMDGNGRWAKERGLHRVAGHNEGINSVREVVRECGRLGVEVLTLYTFSVENWSRPKSEVSALMHLLLKTIRNEVNELHKNNVRLTLMGDLGNLPKSTRTGLLDGVEKTKNNSGLNLNLALSYGSRQEIIEAVKAISRDVVNQKVDINAINDELFSQYLYTANKPDPDLLIRTSGEMRISNFLLWQLAYTEIYVTPIYWPAFRTPELLEAVESYQNRERRFGRTSDQINRKSGTNSQ